MYTHPQDKDKIIYEYDNTETPVFYPPFRLGRKQNRAVLDSKGKEVVIFPKGLESYAKEYVDFLNTLRSK